MNKSNKIRLVLATVVAFFCAGATPAAETIAIGPVETASPGSASIKVLGQTFEVRTDRPTALPAIGAYVVAKGKQLPDGVVVLTSLSVLRDLYVPGASQIFLRGVVRKTDPLRGEISIGGVRVQTSQALVGEPISLRTGDTFDVLGIQSNSGGVVWATRIEPLAAIATRGIEGTGKSIQGIEGTGKVIQGIEGTGKVIQGIEGTGKALQGIEGTGKSIQGIEGTGKIVQGIEGTGKALQGIEGTGKSIQAIEGTGKIVQGIEGTGKALQGIEGTGKLIQGIEGTGKALQGIEGTGKSIQGIEGTGIVIQGIEGTGKSIF